MISYDENGSTKSERSSWYRKSGLKLTRVDETRGASSSTDEREGGNLLKLYIGLVVAS